MQNLRLIIFDLDGTLIDAYAAINSSFNYTLRKLGLKPQKASVIRAAVGWGDGNLLKPFVGPKDLDAATMIYRKHHRLSLIKQSKLYPEVRRLLRQFKARGYKLAVASNRPTEFSLILLKHLRIFNLFNYVLCSDKLKKGKPAPEILNKIVAKFGFKKSQTLYVGDMIIDALAGRRAKIRTIIVTTGSSSLAQVRKERPFKIISEVRKLAQII